MECFHLGPLSAVWFLFTPPPPLFIGCTDICLNLADDKGPIAVQGVPQALYNLADAKGLGGKEIIPVLLGTVSMLL